MVPNVLNANHKCSFYYYYYFKASVFKDQSNTRIFRFGPFVKTIVIFAFPFLSVLFTPRGADIYLSAIRGHFFSAPFSAISFILSSLVPLVVQVLRSPSTKVKFTVCCSQSFLLWSTLQIIHRTVFSATEAYPRTLEMPLIACYITLSLTAGLSVQHGKVAFLLGVLTHTVIFSRVPLSLELVLCWAFVSNYTLVVSFLLLQLRNMRFRVPKVVNSWRGLGVSLNKRETGYVAGIVVLELVRVTNVIPREYFTVVLHVCHILGFGYMTLPMISLLNYST